MHIAVTGATGHLGANLVRLLLADGHAVRALHHSTARSEALEGLAVERMACDVCDPATLAPAFAGIDVVFHLAGLISIRGDPDGRVMRTNVEGTRNVVASCLDSDVGRLVHFSSIHALRTTRTDGVIDESAPPADATSFRYDQSKALGEGEVLAGVEKGLDAVILNPTGVIGPYDFVPSRAGAMLRALFSGRMPLLVEGGFDWVDARDVCRAACDAIHRGRRGERYLLSGHWASFGELGGLCGDIAKRPVRRRVVPAGIARLGLPFSLLSARLTGGEPLFTAESLAIVTHGSRNCSNAKAKRQLGYRPRALAETLRDTHAWFAGRPAS
ncbi:MAG: NAD-dependent epimerase/dehydratase family protein [Bauldia sp.]|uniref:NAD-dependent epimerase/dehydratase family protein n=1 Tax=Bauldia sp. TaxID=2575872 RepID=UPI001DB83B8D|nr:NAD-dependent epimerase/dehydratase family protein [Bauldia sp.]MCB1494469.1 NAD-dependent epimerase/dehydratase family protein [Bauldia sp.]